MNNVVDTPMSVKTSLLALQPDLTLLTPLFVGGLALAVGLASVPAPAHATATTPAGYREQDAILPYVPPTLWRCTPRDSAALWRAEGPVLSEAEGPPLRLVGGQGDAAAVRPSDVLTTYVYLPFIARAEVCQPIPDESYGDKRERSVVPFFTAFWL